MKLLGIACALLIPIAGATYVHAQGTETTAKTKVVVKDGKDVKVTGCVTQADGGTGYMLTNVADKKGALHNYMLVSADSELAKHIGHRVQLEGKVADRGDAKVSIETKTKTKVENGETQKSTHKAEFEGDAEGMAYLGVKSVKMIAAVCP
jgi:hypothetical protein